jgi:hypothetical protein
MSTYLALGPDKKTQWWELPTSWDQHRAHQTLQKALNGQGNTVVQFEVVVEGQHSVLHVNGSNLAAAAIVAVPEPEPQSVLDTFIQT